jgi:hypothetical protein
MIPTKTETIYRAINATDNISAILARIPAVFAFFAPFTKICSYNCFLTYNSAIIIAIAGIPNVAKTIIRPTRA